MFTVPTQNPSSSNPRIISLTQLASKSTNQDYLHQHRNLSYHPTPPLPNPAPSFTANYLTTQSQLPSQRRLITHMHKSHYFPQNQQTYFTDSYHLSRQNCISKLCCPRLSIKNTTNDCCCCNCDGDQPTPDYMIGFEPWCGGVCKDRCWGFFN